MSNEVVLEVTTGIDTKPLVDGLNKIEAAVGKAEAKISGLEKTLLEIAKIEMAFKVNTTPVDKMTGGLKEIEKLVAKLDALSISPTVNTTGLDSLNNKLKEVAKSGSTVGDGISQSIDKAAKSTVDSVAVIKREISSITQKEMSQIQLGVDVNYTRQKLRDMQNELKDSAKMSVVVTTEYAKTAADRITVADTRKNQGFSQAEWEKDLKGYLNAQTQLNAYYDGLIQQTKDFNAKRLAEQHSAASKYNADLKSNMDMEVAAWRNQQQELKRIGEARIAEQNRLLQASQNASYNTRNDLLRASQNIVIPSTQATTVTSPTHQATQIVNPQQTSVINELTNGLNKLQQTLMMVGVALSGRQIMEYADQWTHFTNAVGIATEKTGNAAGMQEKLFALAQNSRAPLESITTLYLRMSRAGETLNMSQGQTVQMIDTVTKSLAIMGTSPNAVRGGLLQLEQALGGVTVRGQEFKSILDSMPNVMTTVAKHYMESDKLIRLNEAALRGASQADLDKIKSEETHILSIAQLRNMMYAGKISSEAFGAAIIAGQSEIDAAFAKTHKTFAQAFTYMENSFVKWIGQMNEGSHFSDTFYKTTVKLGDSLATVAKSMEVLAATFVVFKTTSALAALEIASVVSNLEKVILFVSNINPYVKAATAVAALGMAFYEFKDELKVSDDYAVTWGDVFDNISNKLGNFISDMVTKLKGFNEWLKGTFPKTEPQQKQGLSDFASAKGSGITSTIASPVTGMFSSFIKGIADENELLATVKKSQYDLTKTMSETVGFQGFVNKGISDSDIIGGTTSKGFAQQTQTKGAGLGASLTPLLQSNIDKTTDEGFALYSRLEKANQFNKDLAASFEGAAKDANELLTRQIEIEKQGRENSEIEKQYYDVMRARYSDAKQNSKEFVVGLKDEYAYADKLAEIQPQLAKGIHANVEAKYKQIEANKLEDSLKREAENIKKAAPEKLIQIEIQTEGLHERLADQLKLQSAKHPIELSIDINKGDFFKKLDAAKPELEKAHIALGIDPKMLIAQAANETAWGKSIIGNNLFNIKADKSWTGATVSAKTHEEVNGVSIPTTAKFRAYDSFAESIKDYTKFIQENSRYSKAVAIGKTGDSVGYMSELQKAGYATSSKYTTNVTDIYKGKTLGSAVSTNESSEKQLAVAEQIKIIDQDMLDIKEKTNSKDQTGLKAAYEKYKNDTDRFNILDKTMVKENQLNEIVQSGLRAQIDEQIKLYNIVHQFDNKGETVSAKLARSTAITSLVSDKGAGALPELESSRKALEPKLIGASVMLGDIQRQIDEQKKLNVSGDEEEARVERINSLLDRKAKLTAVVSDATQAMTQYARAEEQVQVKAYEALAKLKERTDTRGFKSGTREGEQAGLLAEKNKAILEVRPALSEADKAAFDAMWERDFKSRTMDIEIKFDNAAMAEAMSQMNNSAKLLADSFGSIGKAIGDVGISLVSMLDLNTQNANKAKEQEDAYNNQRKLVLAKKDNTVELAQLDKDYAKQKSKLDMESAQATIGGFANIAGAASQMFSKQSAGRKALHAVEVGLHAVEIAMSVARTVVKVAEGAASMFAQSGWAGFAGVAGMLAVMAGLGFAAMGGGGGVTDTSTPDSKTKGSVKGDLEASSNSVSNVVDTLNSIHAREYPALLNIADGFKSLFANVNNVIDAAIISHGAFKGSTVGMKATDKNPNGSLGMQLGGLALSTAGGAAGVGAAGAAAVGLGGISTAMSGAAISTGLAVGASSTSAIAIGGAILGLAGGLIFAALAYGLGKLLGIGKTKFEVIGYGIMTQVSEQLVDGMQKQVTVYDYSKVKATTKGWFSDTVKIYDTINGINDELTMAVTSARNEFKDTLNEAINILGVGDLVDKTYIEGKLKLSFNKLKSDEISKKISDALNLSFDNITASVTNGIVTNFSKMGEGAFETLGRLAGEVVVVKDKLARLGITSSSTGLAFVGLADVLVQTYDSTSAAKDGFKNFITAFDSFTDLILTKGEKFANTKSTLDALVTNYNVKSEALKTPVISKVTESTFVNQSAFGELLTGGKLGKSLSTFTPESIVTKTVDDFTAKQLKAIDKYATSGKNTEAYSTLKDIINANTKNISIRNENLTNTLMQGSVLKGEVLPTDTSMITPEMMKSQMGNLTEFASDWSNITSGISKLSDLLSNTNDPLNLKKLSPALYKSLAKGKTYEEVLNVTTDELEKSGLLKKYTSITKDTTKSQGQQDFAAEVIRMAAENTKRPELLKAALPDFSEQSLTTFVEKSFGSLGKLGSQSSELLVSQLTEIFKLPSLELQKEAFAGWFTYATTKAKDAGSALLDLTNTTVDLSKVWDYLDKNAKAFGESILANKVTTTEETKLRSEKVTLAELDPTKSIVTYLDAIDNRISPLVIEWSKGLSAIEKASYGITNSVAITTRSLGAYNLAMLAEQKRTDYLAKTNLAIGLIITSEGSLSTEYEKRMLNNAEAVRVMRDVNKEDGIHINNLIRQQDIIEYSLIVAKRKETMDTMLQASMSVLDKETYSFNQSLIAITNTFGENTNAANEFIATMKLTRDITKAASFVDDVTQAAYDAKYNLASESEKKILALEKYKSEMIKKYGNETVSGVEGTMKKSTAMIQLYVENANSVDFSKALSGLRDFRRAIADWAIGLQITQLGSTKSQLDTAQAKLQYQISAYKSSTGVGTLDTSTIADATVKSNIEKYIAQTTTGNIGKTVEDIKQGIISGITGTADQTITAIKNFYGSSKEGNDLIQQVIDAVSVLPQQVDPQLRMVDLLTDIKAGIFQLPDALKGTALGTTITTTLGTLASVQSSTTIPADQKLAAIDALAQAIYDAVGVGLSTFSQTIKDNAATILSSSTASVLGILATLEVPEDKKADLIKSLTESMKNYTAIIDAKIKDPTADFDIVMKNYQEIMTADLDALNLIIETSMTESGRQSGTNFVTQITSAIESLAGIKIPAFDVTDAVASIDTIVSAAQAALAALQAIGAQRNAELAAQAAADAQAAVNAAAAARAAAETTTVIDTITPNIPTSEDLGLGVRGNGGGTPAEAPTTITDTLLTVASSIKDLAVNSPGIPVIPPITVVVNTGLSTTSAVADIAPYSPMLHYSKGGGAKFATGGAFTNGIVSEPTTFNMGLMGESGSEAIMPLTNVNGKLGVHVVQSANDSNMNSEEELAELRKQNQLLMAQNAILQEGFKQLIIQNAQQNDHLDDISATTRKQVNN